VLGSSCVHAKYQLSSFNIVGAIKEREQKTAIINEILAIFLPNLNKNSKIRMITFFGINKSSL